MIRGLRLRLEVLRADIDQDSASMNGQVKWELSQASEALGRAVRAAHD